MGPVALPFLNFFTALVTSSNVGDDVWVWRSVRSFHVEVGGVDPWRKVQSIEKVFFPF